MSRSSASPISSAITGAPPLGRALESAIGTLRGGPGSGAKRNAAGLPDLPRTDRTPDPLPDARNPAASLPPSLRSWLGEARWRDAAPGAGGWDGFVQAYAVRAGEPPADVVALADAVRGELRGALRPAGDTLLARELARLRALCRARAEDATTIELVLEAYIDQLRDYPAAVVVDVLRTWPRLSPWWPAWEELQTLLDRRTRPYAALLQACDDLVKAA